jgi:hypothetical protein
MADKLGVTYEAGAKTTDAGAAAPTGKSEYGVGAKVEGTPPKDSNTKTAILINSAGLEWAPMDITAERAQEYLTGMDTPVTIRWVDGTEKPADVTKETVERYDAQIEAKKAYNFIRDNWMDDIELRKYAGKTRSPGSFYQAVHAYCKKAREDNIVASLARAFDSVYTGSNDSPWHEKESSLEEHGGGGGGPREWHNYVKAHRTDEVADTNYTYTVFIDGTKEGTYGSKEEARAVVARKKQQAPGRDYRIAPKSRTNMASIKRFQKNRDREIEEAANPAQQAAIAINMKKHHQKPKTEGWKGGLAGGAIGGTAGELAGSAAGKAIGGAIGSSIGATALPGPLSALGSKAGQAIGSTVGSKLGAVAGSLAGGAAGTAIGSNIGDKVSGSDTEKEKVDEDYGSWIVYDPATKEIKKRFKTHTAGKSYAKVHNLGFASSEYYFDNVKEKAVAEGAKVDRMQKHIAKSEKDLGHSKKDAEAIGWATLNKRGYLDNKNKKDHTEEASMNWASHKSTGPKFSGYLKGTDPAPTEYGNKSFGSEAKENPMGEKELAYLIAMAKAAHSKSYPELHQGDEHEINGDDLEVEEGIEGNMTVRSSPLSQPLRKRNFVAKNAIQSGAGKHANQLKKAAAAGRHAKHKGQPLDLDEGDNFLTWAVRNGYNLNKPAVYESAKQKYNSLLEDSGPVAPHETYYGAMDESLKKGEYYVWTVYFDDGSNKRIKVTSDEFDPYEYYAKQKKNVVNVDYNWEIQQ